VAGSSPAAPKRGPGRSRLLTHERIARTAFDLVDAEGPGALTINRLAAELGVGTMTLYGYVESKDEIVAMLPDLLLADLPPMEAERPWREVIREIYLEAYRRLIDHRHVTQLITDFPVFGRSQAEILESVLECLAGAGFGDEEAFALQRAIGTYTVGFARLAIADSEAEGIRPRAAWVEDLDPADFPRISRIASILEAGIDEEQYLRGLDRILGGA
jgi:AcrR family transcriptional regulator